MKNYLDFTQKLNIDNVGFDAKMSPADIMGLFQKAVTEHTFKLQLDFESIRKKYGAKWFIVSARLEIIKAPVIDDVVTVSTWPLKASALKFPRAFVMKDKDGGILANAMTDWCIANCETDEIMKASLLQFPFSDFISENPTEQRCKIPVCDSGELCYERKILLSDLDLNRHVNNVSYLRIAFDCFTMSEMENMQIKSVDMQYKKQTYEGDTISLYKLKTDTGYIIDAKKDGEIVFRAKIDVK